MDGRILEADSIVTQAGASVLEAQIDWDHIVTWGERCPRLGYSECMACGVWWPAYRSVYLGEVIVFEGVVGLLMFSLFAFYIW